MQISRESWSYKVLCEFTSQAFLVKLHKGTVSTGEYYSQVLLHCATLLTYFTVIISFGMAVGTIVLSDVLVRYGTCEAICLGVGFAVTTASLIVAMELLTKRGVIQVRRAVVYTVCDLNTEVCTLNVQIVD